MDAHFGVVQPLLTDYYQITMSYGYWKSAKAEDQAVFELFFRKNPFNGEFTIFAGLTDCVDFLRSFKFTKDDINYLRLIMPDTVDPAFFDYLLNLDSTRLTLWSVDEGSVVFPQVPMMRIEGPLIICQLIETALLVLVNYASLMATNAARFRLAAGPDKQLFEFGLRRAQGPDGGLSASRYAYMGGYDGTSNLLAGKLFKIPVVGTFAHSFVSSFQASSKYDSLPALNTDEIQTETDSPPKNILLDLSSRPLKTDQMLQRSWVWSKEVTQLLHCSSDQVHQGELTAFVNFAVAFPTRFIGLIDTYDVLRSGLPNFCAVALALYEYGHKAIGVRIDSGDLAYLSHMTREAFKQIATYYNLPWFSSIRILVSNDLNEDTLLSFAHQIPYSNHSIDTFCVGTNLVTCQKQPSLGCVYKLVEINGVPTMKFSAEAEKLTLPGMKMAYRFYSRSGEALLDLLQLSHEPTPQANERILCRHPTLPSKRVYVVPGRVEELLKLVLDKGKLVRTLLTLGESRERVQSELFCFRSDYKRSLNPTPYKVSVSDELYNFTQTLWLRMTPISDLS